MKTYKVTYTGNNSRFRNIETEVNATSERNAVEKAYKENLSDNYFSQEDGTIKDCDGHIIARPDSSAIEFDGGFFVAEEITEMKKVQQMTKAEFITAFKSVGDHDLVASNISKRWSSEEGGYWYVANEDDCDGEDTIKYWFSNDAEENGYVSVIDARI